MTEHDGIRIGVAHSNGIQMWPVQCLVGGSAQYAGVYFTRAAAEAQAIAWRQQYPEADIVIYEPEGPPVAAV